MIVRSLDTNNDWTFGQSKSDYKSANLAIAQNIQTRLSSFLGDCFFDTGAGIAWFSFLGSKNQTGLNLTVSSVIANTALVTGVNQVSINLDHVTRIITISYRVTTTYSQIVNQFQYNLAA